MLNQLVAFILGEQQYALPLTTVQRVVRMVEVTPLPKAPEVVLGVIDFQGNIIPVMSMRRRFGSPEAETSLSDQLIVADAGTRSVALVVNSVIGVLERTAEEVTEAEKIVPGAQYVEGITRLEGGILFIHDLERFLSKKEEQQLDGLAGPSGGNRMTKRISDAQLLQLSDSVARHLGLHFPRERWLDLQRGVCAAAQECGYQHDLDRYVQELLLPTLTQRHLESVGRPLNCRRNLFFSGEAESGSF